MTHNEFTDREMKENWRESGEYLENTSPQATQEILQGNHKTALQRLRQRYMRFFRLGMLCAVIVPISFIPQMEDGVLVLPLWVILYMTVYFVLCALMDWVMIQKIDSIDIFRMPTSEVIRRAFNNRKLHLTFIAVLAPLAIAFIGMMLWYNWGNVYLLAGVIAGFVAGVAIGLHQLAEFLKDYRSLMSE